MKSTIVWVVKLDVSEAHIAPNFKVKEQTMQELMLPSASACFSLGLLVDPEDGGDIFLRNVGLSPNYTVLQPKRT
jgi:hypothetical protein